MPIKINNDDPNNPSDNNDDANYDVRKHKIN